jgi:hypothetical protein
MAVRTWVRSDREIEITSDYLAYSDGPFTFHLTGIALGKRSTWQQMCWGRTRSTLAVTPALAIALDIVWAVRGHSVRGKDAVVVPLVRGQARAPGDGIVRLGGPAPTARAPRPNGSAGGPGAM